MTQVPTPQELYDGVHAGLLAEKKRLQDAEAVVAEAKSRIKKASRMLKMMSDTFGIKEDDMPVVVIKAKESKGAGVEVQDGLHDCVEEMDNGSKCTRTFASQQGLSLHVNRAHRKLW